VGIGKIEVYPKEEASVVEVFQEVLDKLSDVEKKDTLLKFFKLVQDGKFPLNNIAFELFLGIVEWFDKFKIPINQDTKFIKKISFNFKIFVSFQTGFHIYSALKIL
jgi:hypothetical protein